MKKIGFAGSSAVLAFVLVPALAPLACSSSSGGTPDTGTSFGDGGKTDTGPKTEAGKGDGGKTDGAKGDGGTHKDAGGDVATTTEAGKTDAKGDSGPSGATHVLVTFDGTEPNAAATTSMMVAVNLATHAVDGRLAIKDGQSITDTSNSNAPFLFGQSNDFVEMLDPVSPWKVSATWSVPPNVDAGGGSSDPYAIAVASDTSAYVIRYSSNFIDVLDLTHPADGGTAKSSINLTSLVQANDQDGNLEATAGVYVAATKTLYVVLGNVNFYDIENYMGNFDTLCGNTTSTVIAIDTTTNMVKPIADGGPGGAIALKGYDPVTIAYDAPGNRILVFEAGCNPSPTTDGGAPGAITKRGVEEVDLATGTSKILLDLSPNDKGFPGNIAYVNAQQVVLGFVYPTNVAYVWNPTLATLGSMVPGAPGTFAYDGHGNLVGASGMVTDAGYTSSVISLSLTTFTPTVLVTNPLDAGTSTYIGSVGLWPHP